MTKRRIAALLAMVSLATGLLVGCGGGTPPPNPMDDYLQDVSWDGSAVKFTAKQDVHLTNISVWAGDREFEGNIVSNESGNMGTPNGSIFQEGSSLGLSTIRAYKTYLIIFSGTVATCAVDAEGATATKVTFKLDGEVVLEKTL